MKKFKNSKKDQFLDSIPVASLDLDNDDITARMKFNFSYFDESQEIGLNITSLSKVHSNKLFKKIKEYSRESLEYWKNIKIGSGKHKKSVYINYVDFPKNSDFKHPKYIPHQVEWGRFRLESDFRLVGFVVPDSYEGKFKKNTNKRFDTNTFYVVFLDHEHRFYLTRK
ncbi:MAG: hypothetical protein JXR48_15020 [Candidatus Delongbacteria bacterium]|nr:hypothetical protein [Candidatus Delongbacteria bacterium]MBN2836268.1 hypothetical protein [Candidatus Delongbacteria bacterium]